MSQTYIPRVYPPGSCQAITQQKMKERLTYISPFMKTFIPDWRVETLTDCMHMKGCLIQASKNQPDYILAEFDIAWKWLRCLTNLMYI